MAQQFRKKPVVIEAMQWTGTNIESAVDFIAGEHMIPLPKAPDDPHIRPGLGFTPITGELTIPTLEGTMTAKPGDWIIRGVKGETYPCKPDILAATYEPVTP